MHIEVVTIGDELLLGYTIDTNAAHLARTLAAEGVEIARRTTVGDDRTRRRRRIRSRADQLPSVPAARGGVCGAIAASRRQRELGGMTRVDSI